MTQQPSDHEQLRNVARDVRFLTYRAGRPHPLALGILLILVGPLLPIIAVTFVVEVGIQMGWMKPVPRRPVQEQHRTVSPRTRSPQLIHTPFHDQEKGNTQ